MSVTMIHKAIQFAAEKHKGQIRRGSKLPYVIHPLTVMYYISKFKGDSKHIDELLCAGILHDTIEDTDCTYIEIERRFGPMVASIVMELTSDEDIIKKSVKMHIFNQK